MWLLFVHTNTRYTYMYMQGWMHHWSLYDLRFRSLINLIVDFRWKSICRVKAFYHSDCLMHFRHLGPIFVNQFSKNETLCHCHFVWLWFCVFLATSLKSARLWNARFPVSRFATTQVAHVFHTSSRHQSSSWGGVSAHQFAAQEPPTQFLIQ